MVVGHDMAGIVPDEAGAGSRPSRAFSALVFGQRIAGGGSCSHLHHGRRHPLEQFDIGTLGLGQRPALVDGPRDCIGPGTVANVGDGQRHQYARDNGCEKHETTVHRLLIRQCRSLAMNESGRRAFGPIEVSA